MESDYNVAEDIEIVVEVRLFIDKAPTDIKIVVNDVTGFEGGAESKLFTMHNYFIYVHM